MSPPALATSGYTTRGGGLAPRGGAPTAFGPLRLGCPRFGGRLYLRSWLSGREMPSSKAEKPRRVQFGRNGVAAPRWGGASPHKPQKACGGRTGWLMCCGPVAGVRLGAFFRGKCLYGKATSANANRKNQKMPKCPAFGAKAPKNAPKKSARAN